MERIRSADGALVAFERSGSGPPLVLVHGTMDDHRYWMPVISDFAAHFTVYALDRRGRGESGPHGEGHEIRREYEDVAAVVDSIGEPVHLLGHSAGARYAMHGALLTSNLRTMTLYEPAPFEEPPPPEFLDRLGAMTAAEDREGIVSAFWSEMVGVPAEEIEEMRGTPGWRISTDNAHTLLSELRSTAGYRLDPVEFSSLRVPVLLLAGSESPPLLRAEVEKAAALLPDSRIIVLEGQGHEAVHTAPELFAREVLRFLVGG